MLISIGLDHRNSNVDLRERLHGLGSDAAERLHAPISEIAWFATCNRVEIYGWVDAPAGSDVQSAFTSLVSSLTTDPGMRRDLLALGVRRLHRDVALHLMRVASGLESQVLGDIHVIGQLKRAFRTALDEGGTGPYLHRLFELSLQAGKRVRSETPLMAGRHSVGSEAAAFALRGLGEAVGRRVLVVGCGKVGSHSAEAFAKADDVELVIVNRSLTKASRLATELGAKASAWTELYAEMARADAVVVATGAPSPVVRADGLAYALDVAARPPESELLVIDISMPRNVCPDVGALDGLRLLNLDGMHPEVAEVERARRHAVPEAEWIVEDQVDRYMAWITITNASEALRPLREVLTQVCYRELEYATDETVALRTVDRIVAKVLSAPMARIREAGTGTDEDLDSLAATMQALFGSESGDEVTAGLSR
jgi:glutamyl-tRNA reductase